MSAGYRLTEISERVSPEFVGGGTKTSETYTESTAKDYRTKDFYQSYQYVEDMVKAQIDYEALKNDNPYDERIDELLGIMVEILTSSSKTIRRGFTLTQSLRSARKQGGKTSTGGKRTIS